MGDLVDNGQDHYQWNAWFDVVSDMIARIPVVPLLGNHETYNKDWKVRMPEAYLHLFALPQIDMEKYQNQFYSFDYGDVHFVVLNTQSQELADFEPSLDEDEVAWFKKDMAQTKKKWKIYRTSDAEGEDLKPVGEVAPGRTITLPARSMTTLLMD